MARRSWRSSLKNGSSLFFSPSPIRPRSEPSRARIGTINRKPLSTSQWRSGSGSLARGERASSMSTSSGSLALAMRVASDEEASSRRLRILGSASIPERGSKESSATLSGWRARSTSRQSRAARSATPWVARTRSASRVSVWRASNCSRKKWRSIESSRVRR